MFATAGIFAIPCVASHCYIYVDYSWDHCHPLCHLSLLLVCNCWDLCHPLCHLWLLHVGYSWDLSHPLCHLSLLHVGYSWDLCHPLCHLSLLRVGYSWDLCHPWLPEQGGGQFIMSHAASGSPQTSHNQGHQVSVSMSFALSYEGCFSVSDFPGNKLCRREPSHGILLNQLSFSFV